MAVRLTSVRSRGNDLSIAAVCVAVGAMIPLSSRTVGLPIVLGGLVAAAVAVGLFLDWRVGPFLLAAALPYENLIANDGTASGMKLLTAASVGSVVVHALWDRTVLKRLTKLLADRATVVLLCLLAWSLLSVTWAAVSPSAATTRSGTLLGVMVLMVLIAMLKPGELKTLWSVVFISSVLSVLLALVVEPPAPDVPAPWGMVARFTSGGHHPVDYGGILAVIGVIAFLGVRWRGLGPLRYGCLLLLAIGLVSTGTRAAVVALALVPILMALVGTGRRRSGSRFGVFGLVLLMIAAAALVVRLSPTTGNLVEARYSQLGDVRSEDTWTGRWDLWSGAVDVFGESPLTGVGAGNFPLVAPHYSGFAANMVYTGKGSPVAHNIVLGVAADLGLVGLSLFLLFLGVMVRRAWSTRGDSRLATALTVALGCYLVIGMSLSWEYLKLPYVMYASITSLYLAKAPDQS